jgi:protein gp37
VHDGVTVKRGTRRVYNGKLTVAADTHPLWRRPLILEEPPRPNRLGPGKPSLIYVGMMGDLFVTGRPTAIIDRVVATVALSDHIGLLCSRYTANMAAYIAQQDPDTVERWKRNIWLGFSAEDQPNFYERWSDMRALAAQGWTVLCSLAPLIGPVRLPEDYLQSASWTIVCGEQGPHSRCRPMEVDWARNVRDQCQDRMPFFMRRMAKNAPIPPDLWIREFPEYPRPPQNQNISKLIHIRGTNGAGKSTLVRRLMEQFSSRAARESLVGGPRNRIIGYRWPALNIVVVGPYETPTGGCDNFASTDAADWLFNAIKEYHAAGNHVIWEAHVTYGAGRMVALHSATRLSLQIIQLSTELDVCISSVNGRRRARAATGGRPFVPVPRENVERKFTSLFTSNATLEQHGIPVVRLGRTEAFDHVLGLVGGIL